MSDNENKILHSRISTAGVARRGERFFVAKRKSGSSIGDSWEFPGGKNRDGETPQETLKREYAEEFSVDISVGNQLMSSTFTNKRTKYELMAFEIVFKEKEPEFILTEHSQVGWKSLQELSCLPMAPSDRTIFQALSEKVKTLHNR